MFGLAPTFWPVKVSWLLQAGDPQGWLALAAGLAYSGLLFVLLLLWFNVVMQSGR